MPSPGGRRELDQVIGELASTPLDRGRPLWEFYFAEGMADNRYALVGKVHHTLADGAGIGEPHGPLHGSERPSAAPEGHFRTS